MIRHDLFIFYWHLGTAASLAGSRKTRTLLRGVSYRQQLTLISLLLFFDEGFCQLTCSLRIVCFIEIAGDPLLSAISLLIFFVIDVHGNMGGRGSNA